MDPEPEEIPDPDCDFTPRVKDPVMTYRAFTNTMDRLLSEGYSPLAVVCGLQRAAARATRTLEDEIYPP